MLSDFTCRTSNAGVACALIRGSCHRWIKRLNCTVSSFVKLLFQPTRCAAQTCYDLLPNQYIDQVIHGVVDGDSWQLRYPVGPARPSPKAAIHPQQDIVI
jgi:hypothetical protein